MKLAIQGCSHGELDSIYASVLRTERENSIQIDALLLCGDFQAIRNHSDLHCLAVPPKYLALGDFHSYYSGAKVAPLLTIVIGGNHEASNYFHELFHGGWLAPNIYFLGQAGVVELNGLILGGISGIWKGADYGKGRFERLPYDAGTLRSAYHTREFDVTRLKAMEGEGRGVGVVMSHDWPNTIEQWGDTEWLIKKKPWFKDEVESQTLGSPPLMELLQVLKPSYWFSAHLHVKFPAIYQHDQSPKGAEAKKGNGAEGTNPEAINIDLDFDTDDQPQAQEAPPSTTTNSTSSKSGEVTRFLALHKCLSHSPFLQILDIPSPHDDRLTSLKSASNYQTRIAPTFRFNKRWLAITRAYHPHFSLQYRQPPLPSPSDPAFLRQIEEEERWIESNLLSSTKNGGKRKQDEPQGSKQEEEEEKALDIGRVQQFVRTAPAPFEPGGLNQGPPAWYTNPQTEAFCRFVGIENKINPRPPQFFNPQHALQAVQQHLQPEQEADPNALSIGMDDLDSEPEEKEGLTTLSDDDELNARWKEGTG